MSTIEYPGCNQGYPTGAGEAFVQRPGDLLNAKGAYALRVVGLPIAEVARALGVSPTAVRLGVARVDTILKSRGLAVKELVRTK